MKKDREGGHVGNNCAHIVRAHTNDSQARRNETTFKKLGEGFGADKKIEGRPKDSPESHRAKHGKGRNQYPETEGRK